MDMWLDFALVALALGAGWLGWVAITAARLAGRTRLPLQTYSVERRPGAPRRPVVNAQAVDSEP